MNTRRTLRKVNIKERPKSSAFKVFREQNILPTSCYSVHYSLKPCVNKRVTNKRYTQSQCFSDNSCQALKLPQIPSELNKNIISSIYQEDYMNMNEQLRQKQKPHPLNHPRRRNVYAESIAQSSYQSPLIKDTLKGYTTRYECNKEMVIEAKGIVPTVCITSRDYQMGNNALSLYESDYTTRQISDKSSSTIPSLPKLTRVERIGIVRKGKRVLKCVAA